jgi:hypothetical protein
MPNSRLVAAIALVICIPLLFSVLGTGQRAGIAIGVVLVVVGLGVGALGSRGDDEGAPPTRRDRP